MGLRINSNSGSVDSELSSLLEQSEILKERSAQLRKTMQEAGISLQHRLERLGHNDKVSETIQPLSDKKHRKCHQTETGCP